MRQLAGPSQASIRSLMPSDGQHQQNGMAAGTRTAVFAARWAVQMWSISMGVSLQKGLQRAAHGSDSDGVVSLLAGGGGGGGGGDGGGGNSGPQGNHPEISTRDLPVSFFLIATLSSAEMLVAEVVLHTAWSRFP